MEPARAAVEIEEPGAGHRALADSVEALRRAWRAAPARTAAGPIELTPWMQREVQQYFDAGGASDHAELVVRGVALVAKAGRDRDRAAVTAGASSYAAQAELMLDHALGRALVRQTQAAIERAVQAGRIDDAKSLSTFQHALRRALADLTRIVVEGGGGSPPPVPESLAPVVVLEEEEDRPSPTIRPRARRRVRRRATSPRSEPSAAGPRVSRSLVLLLGFVGSLLSWMLAVQAPRALRDAPLPVAVGELGVAGLLDVRARPPSAYVTVDTAFLGTRDPAANAAMLQQVAAALEARGYRGALFSTSDGRPVARWLAGTRPQPIQAEEPPVAAGPESLLLVGSSPRARLAGLEIRTAPDRDTERPRSSGRDTPSPSS
jgi:hypothetical protein